MVLLTNQTAKLYESSLLTQVKSLNVSSYQNVLLQSGDQRILVHPALLRKASPFLSSLLSSNCSCQSFAIILPSSSPSTLAALVDLLYTGSISGLSRQQVEHGLTLARALGIDVNSKEYETKDYNIDSPDVIDFLSYEDESDIAELEAKQLKTETLINIKGMGGNLKFKFPISRSRREISNLQSTKKMSGFKARIKKEYNRHPVGKYMGPYDLNKKLKLNIQLPDSDLDFNSFTEFNHEGCNCYEYTLKRYEHYDNLDKIDAYRIRTRLEEVSDSSSSEEDDDMKVYTCKMRKCKIPCPCSICHLDQEQCSEHKIKHEVLFDEKNDAFSTVSSENFCIDEKFFNKSYTLKYSGIPVKCVQCQQDILHHQSYHFVYHDKCRFCKQNWYKQKAETAENLKSLEKREKYYFTTVCPYCNKQFESPSNAKRHVKNEHGNGSTKFNRKKVAPTDEETKRLSLIVSCEVCRKTFSSEINLKVIENMLTQKTRHTLVISVVLNLKKRRT